MTSGWKRLLAPELFWLLLYGAMYFLASTNQPPTEAGSQSLEKWWFILSLLVVPSTFAFLAFAPARPWIMLLRVNIAALIALPFVSYAVTSGIDYQDSRNSGVPMGWILSISFGWFTQFIAILIAVPILWWNHTKKRNGNTVDASLG